MLFGMGTPEISQDPDIRGHRAPLAHWLIAAGVSLVVIIAGTLIVNMQSREFESRHKVDLLFQGSAMRARLSRELNRVLYLTSGLSSYLAVRHNSLQDAEVESILERLFRDSPHIRNFGIAIGLTVTHVYPVKGNEKAIGLHYPDLPEQWPAIKRIIETGRPTLTGPVQLIQGGTGLIYRIPIFIDDKYWGLLSSVIDPQTLLTNALDEVTTSGLAIAIRGKDSTGMDGAVFWGEPALFTSNDVQLVDIDVPGGKWVMAMRSTEEPNQLALWLIQILVWILALILGLGAMVLLSQRNKLTRLAMFDPLTGVPNRLLTDDRISLALSGLRRDKTRTCLMLFIDLDGFKLINDRYGHKAGDAALQSTASRLENAIREADTVARWGGDEFIVFMENVEFSSIGEITQKIRDVIEVPIAYGPHELRVGASIGPAYAPKDGLTLDELVHVADERMYADKAARKSTAPAA